MRYGSLFSGIGGFDLAAERMGWEIIFQVEIDKFCTKVLAKNFPNVKRYGDIKEFDGTKYRGLINILSGGPPCQPASLAGERKGENDDRWLWPEMLRVVREVKPSFVVGENPIGILSLAKGKLFKGILSALENEGYQTELFIIPACGIGAWHKRERIWIIAYNNNERFQKFISHRKEQQSWFRLNRASMCPISQKLNPSEAFICRGNDGIPNRVDRIKGLGNAIIPQIAFEIFKAIEQYDTQTTNQES